MKVPLLLFVILQPLYFATQSEGKHLVVSLTKTQCFGECPAFEFELYSDCTAKFNGIAFTSKSGRWKSNVTKREFKNLISEFENSEFFKFEDRYYAEFTDLPTTYIFFTDGASEKKIMDYYGAPQKLKDLERKVENLIDSLEWKQTTN